MFNFELSAGESQFQIRTFDVHCKGLIWAALMMIDMVITGGTTSLSTQMGATFTGATNTIRNRFCASLQCRGPDQAKLIVLIGPLFRTGALAMGRKLKQKRVKSRGIGVAGHDRLALKITRRICFKEQHTSSPNIANYFSHR